MTEPNSSPTHTTSPSGENAQRAREGLFIAGPCVIESADLLNTVAETLVDINKRLGTDIIFKASFDKANRTSITSFRGPGMERGLQMLADIKEKYGLRILTDIHESHQAAPVAEVCDVLQIPAFLCRQTDLLVAAAKTGRTVNIKKAQFLSGQDMRYPVQKVLDTWKAMGDGVGVIGDGVGVIGDGVGVIGDGYMHPTPSSQHQTPNTKHPTPNTKHQTPSIQHPAPNTKHQTPSTQHPAPNTQEVWLTERGNSFGYNNLVVDFRNIPDMLQFTPRVIMDCTHSVQRPGGADGKTGGDRRFVPAMAKAAKAFGATGYFFEVHPDPDRGLSDAANMLELDKLEELIKELL